MQHNMSGRVRASSRVFSARNSVKQQAQAEWSQSTGYHVSLVDSNESECGETIHTRRVQAQGPVPAWSKRRGSLGNITHTMNRFEVTFGVSTSTGSQRRAVHAAASGPCVPCVGPACTLAHGHGHSTAATQTLDERRCHDEPANLGLSVCAME